MTLMIAYNLDPTDMDTATTTYLSKLNARFYERNAASFDATRKAPWRGWEPVARLLEQALAADPAARADGTPARVLDVACGNMRLAGFLESALPGRPLSYLGVDGCEALAPTARRASFRRLDIVEELLASRPLPEGLRDSFDLVACFGFFHHVPGSAVRTSLLRHLVQAARPGGLVAASFWQFMGDARLSRKARAATSAALDGQLPPLDLDPGDFFLGWQGSEASLRYCHHFEDAEIDALGTAIADLAEPVARYRADGSSGRLNAYLVLRRHPTDPGPAR